MKGIHQVCFAKSTSASTTKFWFLTTAQIPTLLLSESWSKESFLRTIVLPISSSLVISKDWFPAINLHLPNERDFQIGFLSIVPSAHWPENSLPRSLMQAFLLVGFLGGDEEEAIYQTLVAKNWLGKGGGGVKASVLLLLLAKDGFTPIGSLKTNVLVASARISRRRRSWQNATSSFHPPQARLFFSGKGIFCILHPLRGKKASNSKLENSRRCHSREGEPRIPDIPGGSLENNS